MLSVTMTLPTDLPFYFACSVKQELNWTSEWEGVEITVIVATSVSSLLSHGEEEEEEVVGGGEPERDHPCTT